jgi:hypothetical protein
MELLGPVPFKIRHRFETAEMGGPQSPFEAASGPLVEFMMAWRTHSHERLWEFVRRVDRTACPFE